MGLQAAASLAVAASGSPFIPEAIEEAARAHGHVAFADSYQAHWQSHQRVAAQCNEAAARLEAEINRPHLVKYLAALSPTDTLSVKKHSLILPKGQKIRTSNAAKCYNLWILRRAGRELAHHICAAAQRASPGGHKTVVDAVQHEFDTRLEPCVSALHAALSSTPGFRTQSDCGRN